MGSTTNKGADWKCRRPFLQESYARGLLLGPQCLLELGDLSPQASLLLLL